VVHKHRGLKRLTFLHSLTIFVVSIVISLELRLPQKLAQPASRGKTLKKGKVTSPLVLLSVVGCEHASFWTRDFSAMIFELMTSSSPGLSKMAGSSQVTALFRYTLFVS
jgi:hypothetical protein